jgi:hypothetical protein
VKITYRPFEESKAQELEDVKRGYVPNPNIPEPRTISLGEEDIGNTRTLTATVQPPDATNKDVVWTTSDLSVATVLDGVVTAVGYGYATITVSTVDGEWEDTFNIAVSQSEIYH